MKMCLPAYGHNVHTIIMDGTSLVDRTLSSYSLVNLPGSIEQEQGHTNATTMMREGIGPSWNLYAQCLLLHSLVCLSLYISYRCKLRVRLKHINNVHYVRNQISTPGLGMCPVTLCCKPWGEIAYISHEIANTPACSRCSITAIKDHTFTALYSINSALPRVHSIWALSLHYPPHGTNRQSSFCNNLPGLILSYSNCPQLSATLVIQCTWGNLVDSVGAR